MSAYNGRIRGASTTVNQGFKIRRAGKVYMAMYGTGGKQEEQIERLDF